MAEEGLADLVGRVLRDAPFAMRQLAADSGLSYDVLRSWRSGRRRPSRASVQRLAQGLEQRGQQLLQLSQELRESSGGQGGEATQSRQAQGEDGSPPPPTPEQSLAGGAVHGTAQTSVPPRTTGATHMSGGNLGRPGTPGGGQVGTEERAASSRPTDDQRQSAAGRQGSEEQRVGGSRPGGSQATSPAQESGSGQGGGGQRPGGSQATDGGMAAGGREVDVKPRRSREGWERDRG